MPLVVGETARGPASRHIFAIVCCVRSTKVQTLLNETSLYRTLYPSLRNTVTPRERKLWRVRLYLCADDNDQLFQRHAAQVAADSPPGLETRLLFIPARANRVPSREAAEQARLDGAEYFHRTNDDIGYLSAGWLTASVRALRRLEPPPRLRTASVQTCMCGSVGPSAHSRSILPEESPATCRRQEAVAHNGRRPRDRAARLLGALRCAPGVDGAPVDFRLFHESGENKGTRCV